MRSTLNLNNIRRSLSGLSDSVKGAIKRSEQISDNIKDRNLAKKESISMSAEFFAKRRDNLRRKEKEDILEAGSVMGILRSSGKAIQRTTKGFLGRILDFVGTIILGWAILNLPKIIKVAQDLIKRMQLYFGILSKFVNDVASLFTSFGNNIKEVGQQILQFNFLPFKDQIESFMTKIRNAFDQLVLNTIKTVKVFSDKTERELAEELGLLNLYDKLNKGEPLPESEDVDKDPNNEKDDEDDTENLSQDDLIKQGIEQLKIFRGGELTKTDTRKIKGKSNQEIHDYLIEGEKLILMRSKVNGTIQYMLLKDYLAENTLTGNRLDEYLEPVPRNYFSLEASTFSDDGMSDENIKRLMELEDKGIYGDDAMDIIEGRKKLIDFQLPEQNNNINVDVPIEVNKSGFNFMGTENGNKYEEAPSMDNFKSNAYQRLNE